MRKMKLLEMLKKAEEQDQMGFHINCDFLCALAADASENVKTAQTDYGDISGRQRDFGAGTNWMQQLEGAGMNPYIRNLVQEALATPAGGRKAYFFNKILPALMGQGKIENQIHMPGYGNSYSSLMAGGQSNPTSTTSDYESWRQPGSTDVKLQNMASESDAWKNILQRLMQQGADYAMA